MCIAIMDFCNLFDFVYLIILEYSHFTLLISYLNHVLRSREEVEKVIYNIFILGVYNPLTMEGTIIIDGLVASCYASFDHDLAHLVMTPVQWFPGMIQWIFGADNGSSGYACMAEEMGRLMIPSDILFK